MADPAIACTSEILFSGNDSPFDLISAEEQDSLVFVSTSYKSGRQPLGQSWGRFEAVAVGSSTLSQDMADLRADMTAWANAWNPEDAIPSEISPDSGVRDVSTIGDVHSIPQPDCAECAPREWDCPADYIPPTEGGSGGTSNIDFPQGTVVYRNTPQSVTLSCTDGRQGSDQTVVVASGTYTSMISQDAADQEAYEAAYAEAEALRDANCHWYNVQQDCPVGMEGASIPAGTYMSDISQADADSKAQAALDCLFWNVQQDCPVGMEGTPIPAHTYSSPDSQAAADSLAAAELECLYWNTEQTGTANCTPPKEGETESVTVAAHQYSSATSQAAADTAALNAANAAAAALLYCCDPPCDPDDLGAWTVDLEYANPTASISITDQSGTYNLDSSGAFSSAVRAHKTWCSPWDTYTLTITVHWDMNRDGGSGYPFNVITLILDGTTYSYTLPSTTSPVSGNFVKTMSITPGNHTIDVSADIIDGTLSGTVTLSPSSHP